MARGRKLNVLRLSRSAVRYMTPVALLIYLSGCGAPASKVSTDSATSNSGGATATAATICSTKGLNFAVAYGEVKSVSGAFESSAAGVAAIQTSRFGPDGPKVASSDVQSRPDTEKMFLCYFDGDFEVMKGPPPGGTSATRFTRLSVVVTADGLTFFDAAGPAEDLPAAGPSN